MSQRHFWAAVLLLSAVAVLLLWALRAPGVDTPQTLTGNAASNTPVTGEVAASPIAASSEESDNFTSTPSTRHLALPEAPPPAASFGQGPLFERVGAEVQTCLQTVALLDPRLFSMKVLEITAETPPSPTAISELETVAVRMQLPDGTALENGAFSDCVEGALEGMAVGVNAADLNAHTHTLRLEFEDIDIAAQLRAVLEHPEVLEQSGFQREQIEAYLRHVENTMRQAP